MLMHLRTSCAEPSETDGNRDAVLHAAWRCSDDGRLEIGWRLEPSVTNTEPRIRSQICDRVVFSGTMLA
jgi:hypothetical protein